MVRSKSSRYGPSDAKKPSRKQHARIDAEIGEPEDEEDDDTTVLEVPLRRRNTMFFFGGVLMMIGFMTFVGAALDAMPRERVAEAIEQIHAVQQRLMPSIAAVDPTPPPAPISPPTPSPQQSLTTSPPPTSHSPPSSSPPPSPPPLPVGGANRSAA